MVEDIISKPLASLELQHIIKHYDSKSIDFIKKEGKMWLTSNTMALGLGINKYNILQIYGNNKELLEPYSTNMKIISVDGKRREVRVFDKIGFIGICIRSNSPKAIPFQKWVLQIIEEIEEKGYYIEKPKSILELMKKQSEMFIEFIEETERQREKLKFIESKVESFEQRYEEEKGIKPQTKKDIKDFVNNCTKLTGLHWGHFWPKIWKRFGISTTTGISEKLGQEILKWLKENRREFLHGEIQYKKLS